LIIPARNRVRGAALSANAPRSFQGLTCNFLALALFGGAPYGVDEAGVVKCVFKPGYVVGARMHIADEMSVDLSDVYRRTHEPTGNRRLLGWHECDV
jgi:hypothetical protein